MGLNVDMYIIDKVALCSETILTL